MEALKFQSPMKLFTALKYEKVKFEKGQNKFVRHMSLLNLILNPHMSVERLALNIGVIYRRFPSKYDELNESYIIDIQRRVNAGTYKLSPLQIKLFTTNEELRRPYYYHKFRIPGSYNLYGSVICTPEDNLVLTTLAIMLNRYFIRKKPFLDNIYGFSYDRFEYYSIVSKKDSFVRVFKLNLLNSMNTLDRELLLCKLSDIITDRGLIDLLRKLLYSPLKDQNGIDRVSNMKIPPVGYIADVLLNFALIDFDKEFKRRFPQLQFTRFYNEVLVYFPAYDMHAELCFKTFEEEVIHLFKQLELTGTIESTGPGNEPIDILGAQVSVPEYGKILIKEVYADDSEDTMK